MNFLKFTSNGEMARLSYSRKNTGMRLTTPMPMVISATSPIIKNAAIENIAPIVANNNILYLFAHKTLTDFEVPIIISRGYGVFMPKKKTSLNKCDSVYDDPCKYDDSLQNISVNDLHMLNDIDWYNNNTILTRRMIDLLNRNFNYIFITLLTSGKLLTQLITQFKGLIYYRFFGLASTYSYKPMVINYASPNVKYLFSYHEIYTYEKSLSSFFNSNNSHVIPLGCPDNFIKTHENMHKGTNNKICFVCSKINQCPYYTNIYHTFMKNIGTKYEYVLLGKNNETLTDDNKFNNLSDDAYFNKMSECKLMYYHSTEPRHLHYHPIEALIIGLPVLFHKESLLNSFLMNSPGKCNDINEVHAKIDRILNNDIAFVNKIKKEQQNHIYKFEKSYNMNAFDNVIQPMLHDKIVTSICCGLGDCLLYCQLYDLHRFNNFKYTYVLNLDFVKLHRNLNHINYIFNIFKFFNVPLSSEKNSSYEYISGSQMLKEYPICRPTLAEHLKKNGTGLPNKYILINLNIRQVVGCDDFDEYIVYITDLCNILNDFEFKLPVVLIGQRQTHTTTSVINYSFYNKLKINGNKFIDKSNETDLIDTPEIDNLMHDINIIQNAEETFQFGFGGSLCLNCIFSKKVSCVINQNENLNDTILPSEFCTNWLSICENITLYKNGAELLNRLKTYTKCDV